VNFVIKRDKKDLFRFASLQSESAFKLATKFNFDTSKQDTFILLEGDTIYTKSTAALLICKQLNSTVRIFYVFIILPKIFRDFIYDLIAKNRYKIFGKRDVCRIPTQNDKQKFLG
jgi:predicted DCC family thiol-disulfide oxidoreductase YuxK